MLRKHVKMLTLCALCIALIATYLTDQNPTDKQTREEETSTNAKPDNQVIYYLDVDDQLVPVSTHLIDSSDIEQLVLSLVSKTTEGNVINEKRHRPLLPDDTEVLGLELKDKILTINFSKEFANYDKKDELRIVEGLVWMLTKPDGIDGIIIQVEGVTLEKMPVDNLPLKYPLTRTVGINNFESTTSRIHDTESIVVYFEKTFDDHTYYIPVTKRISRTNGDKTKLVNAILGDISVTSGIRSITTMSAVQLVTEPIFEDGLLTVNLSDASLKEEGVMAQAFYEKLVLSLSELSNVSRVNVLVNGESVSVDGHKPTEIQVSDIIINQVEL